MSPAVNDQGDVIGGSLWIETHAPELSGEGPSFGHALDVTGARIPSLYVQTCLKSSPECLQNGTGVSEKNWESLTVENPSDPELWIAINCMPPLGHKELWENQNPAHCTLPNWVKDNAWASYDPKTSREKLTVVPAFSIPGYLLPEDQLPPYAEPVKRR